MKGLFLILFLVFGCSSVFAQIQEQVDSLKCILTVDTEPSLKRLNTINKLLILISDPTESIHYGNHLIVESAELGHQNFLRRGYNTIGGAHSVLGNLDKAIEAYIKAAGLARDMNNKVAEGHTFLNIGGVYYQQADFSRALESFHKALKIYRSISHDMLIGKSYVRMGYANYSLQNYELAISNVDSADYYLAHADDYISNLIKVYSRVPRVLSLARLNNVEMAEQLLPEIVESFNENKIYVELAYTQVEMGNAYWELGQIEKAKELLLEGYSLSLEHGLKITVQDASKQLMEVYKSQGDYEKALKYQSIYYAY